jgi:glutaredoxin
MVLDGKKIPYTLVDIAADSAEKDRMRHIAGNDRALAPQLANGNTYCGGYEAFDEAVEFENLEQFLHL